MIKLLIFLHSNLTGRRAYVTLARLTVRLLCNEIALSTWKGNAYFLCKHDFREKQTLSTENDLTECVIFFCGWLFFSFDFKTYDSKGAGNTFRLGGGAHHNTDQPRVPLNPIFWSVLGHLFFALSKKTKTFANKWGIPSQLSEKVPLWQPRIKVYLPNVLPSQWKRRIFH